MATTETLELKTPEVESPAKEDDDRVVDSEKEAITPEIDDKKGEEDDGESEEEDETKKSSVTTTPLSNRPTRKRKKVERYSLPTPFRSSGSKPVSIEKGRGTQLKEIPNVAYKLSKRKPDDNLLLLHTILYGKKAKAQMLKRNIGQFSGFVWSEKEEEKQRARAKDKLEKCIKEKLIDFCDVLDIPVNKSNVKKEELTVLVLEFLVYPKATRDVVLADREQQTKRRKKNTQNTVTSVESSDVLAKRRETMKSEKNKDQPSKTEEGDVGSEDDAVQEKERNHKDNETEDEKDKAEEKNSSVKKSSSEKTVKESLTNKDKEKPGFEEEKSLKGSAKSSRKSTKQVKKSTLSSNKQQKVDQNDDSLKEKSNKQRRSKPQAKGSKDLVKVNKKGERDPTRKEMQVVVAKILKEVDFNTATLSDILRKLGIHFGVELMHRKGEVKDIIKDVIDEMSDEENTV